jgi:predicted AlkP superfamily phosphohydrolase/phosphomutase
MNRVLLLGIDGITYSVLDPAFEAGHMPRLKKLLADGASGILTSTIPHYTPPGSTSIFTGVNPGKHGIFGFTIGNVQRRGGLVRLDRVQVPALWNAANAQGARIGLFNIPMCYPPPRVQGWAVSGMLTPEEGGQTPANFTFPASLAEEITAAADGYEIDIEVNYDKDWRSTAIIDRLSRNLAAKSRALEHLLERHSDLQMLFAVLEAPDRLMHVHYKYLDPNYEHFYRPDAKPIRERAWQFFDEMDEVTGEERRALPGERAGQGAAGDVLGDAVEQAGEWDLLGGIGPVAGEDLIGLPAEEKYVHAPRLLEYGHAGLLVEQRRLPSAVREAAVTILVGASRCLRHPVQRHELGHRECAHGVLHCSASSVPG